MAVQNSPEKRNSLATRAVQDVYPVSRLVREARAVLDGSFPLLWVEGEISNLAMPSSGHIYFTLKDEAAQVRCAMFRNRNQYLRFTPENGMQVLLRVRVTLYEGRGEFQLIAEHMEEAGSGALQRAYEALKQRLGQEGLFAESHKKALPTLPNTIGIISSPDGAAVHDILSVLQRRFPAVDVILYPVTVQGEASARQLTQAVMLADARQECDVLIIGRGGGSLEDLWSFNDEKLARAIFQCRLPIVSAVGHEVDFTISDFVADVRAATPSAAAELVVPDAQQLWRHVQTIMQRLTSHIHQFLHNESRHIQHLQRRLPQPKRQLNQQIQQLVQQQQRLQLAWQRHWSNRQQQLDYLATRLKHPQARIDQQKNHVGGLLHRLKQAFFHQQQRAKQRLDIVQQRLYQQLPAKQVQQQNTQLRGLSRQLQQLMRMRLEQARQRLAQPVRTLAAVSPLNTLERGYSITTKAESAEVISDANSVRQGEQIIVRLHQGQLQCEVTQIKK